MERPYTICHILSALDGKITGPFMEMPEVSAVSGEYARIRDEYHADAWLYGTKTTKEFTDFQKPVLNEGKTDVPEGDFIAGAHESLYYVSIDTLGEIAWSSGTFRKSGRPDAHVIEVLTEQAPALSESVPAGFRLKKAEALRGDGVRLLYTAAGREL